MNRLRPSNRDYGIRRLRSGYCANFADEFTPGAAVLLVAHFVKDSRSGNMGLGDIYYSFAENAAANTANGGFNIEADEYELYLSAMMMGFGNDQERFSPEAAAERLWAEFLQQAGVSYD